MSNSNESFVSLNNVSKKYNDFLALDKVSFDIGKGENFGYIGPNGAGKTTTIKIIIGLISEFEGSVRVGDYTMPGTGKASTKRSVIFLKRFLFRSGEP